MIEFPTPIRWDVVVRFEGGSSQLGPLRKGFAFIDCLNDAGLVTIEQGGTRQFGKIDDRTVANAVWNECCRGVAVLLRVTQVSKEQGALQGRFHAFASPKLLWPGMGFDPIEIEVDENLLPSGVSLSRLTNDVSLGSFDDGASTIEGYALLLAPAGMEKAEPEEVSAAFAIVGAKRQVHVYTIASSDSIRLVARRIVPAPGRVDPALRLARATFRFVDQAERLSAVALSRFEELAKAPGAYLETWDLYDAKSQEADETRKTDVGKISISSRTVEVKGEVWDVPRRVIERLNQGDRLEPWREESEQQVRQVGG